MQLIEVNDKKTIREFLELPVKLYKSEKNWIRPLDKDIETVFDPKKNKLFRDGVCARVILQNDQGETIGRVASFINKKTAYSYEQPTGGMGFFECINDKDSAFALFDFCKNWLQAQGMEAMDGPVNFGDRDRWWGLLVEGFTEPNYGMFYHMPYYKELFEAYGFREYYKQYTYARITDDPLPEKTLEKAERLRRDPKFSVKFIKKSKIDRFAEDFRTIYNKAWVNHVGVKPMSKEQALSIFKKMKPVLDENIVCFAYHAGEPIGFYINLPELNQLFKYVNGNLNLWGKLVFLWHKLLKTNQKIFGVVFGVVPEFQSKGVESLLIKTMKDKILHKKSYRYLEMNWIGDFNVKMIRMVEGLVGGTISKVHVTYRKLFDETKEFKRMPFIK